MVTAASVIADMKGNDRYLPGSNPGAGWSRGGFITMGADWRGQATPTWWGANNKYFGYWNAVLPWFVIWDGEGHQGGLNARLWIKRIEFFIKNTSGAWVQLQDTTSIGGEPFSRNLIDSSGGLSERVESAGGRSVIINPGSGPVYHGWSTFTAFSGSDVRGVHHRVTFELIKDNPNGVDDRNRAVYCVEAGADAYVFPGQSVNDFSPTGYNPGIGASKFKIAPASGEMTVCMTTLSSALEVEQSSNGGKQSYFVMSEAEFLANLPPGVTLVGGASPPPAPAPTPTPTPVPPPVPVGRKELWFAGNSTGSTQDGTAANPINSLATLRTAIQTYGPTGIDLRMTSGGIWTGIFPVEVFQYVGATIRGNDWLSDLGNFEGGVRKTDWSTETGAPGGKQLWKCTTMSEQSPTTSFLQVGAVSIDDAVIASRTFTTLAPTITAMNAFESAYTFNQATNIVYLLLPTGVNPNTLVTMVSQTSQCLFNADFSAQGNQRTGIVLEHLRFKRFSGFPVNLSNLPGVQIRNLYGKHIGGRYRPTPEGKFIELYGGCDNAFIEDIRGDGIADAIVSLQVRAGVPVQSSVAVRRVTGIHIGGSVVDIAPYLKDTGVMDGLLLEDISGANIGAFRTDSRRPDGIGVGLLNVTAPLGAGTSSVNNLTLRRGVAVDSPIARVDFGYSTAGRSLFFEGCQGKTTVTVDYGIAFGHTVSGAGSDFFAFRACAMEGYARGIKNNGGAHSFAVEVTNCGFDGLGVAAIDMQGVANTVLTVQNNVAHASTIMVRAINGPGSSLVNEGGSYVSTGTSLGYTAIGTDDTAQADPGFVGNSVAKPPSGSILYSGGTALNITLADRLGQTFAIPWAQGAYALYNASDGDPGVSPPVSGGVGGLSVWEQHLTTLGDIAYLAEQTGTSLITGISGVPTTVSIVVGETRTLSPTVTGVGQYSGTVTYSVVSGTSATVNSQGAVKGVFVGDTSIRIASTQAPTVFVTVAVTVINFAEYPISAVPPTLALNLIEGDGSVTIFANGKTQAGLSALSTNSQIAVAAERTSFGGVLTVTPVAVGTCIILVTKASRSGGQLTIEIPVVVTVGTAVGDVTEIRTAGNHTIFINQTPYFIPLTDQHDEPITGFDHVISVEVSDPGYVAAPHTVIDGTLPVYPIGVGIATLALELHDATAGPVRKSFTVEVLPIGGSATPPPPPPPPIGPTNPDPTAIAGDFIFEVKGE